MLKIDRSFVNDLGTNRSHRVIVQTTITLARSLGLTTVAEGVERQEQVDILRELGCDVVQGYLIRRPAAGAEIAKWLADFDRGGHPLRPRSGSAGSRRQAGPAASARRAD
jgi:EAL domain-containing protein (putative c-di-GMP-specific phosphodiesterase class I)